MYDSPDENSEESESDSLNPDNFSDHGGNSVNELDDTQNKSLIKESNVTGNIDWIDNFEWYQDNPIRIEKITSDGYKLHTEDDDNNNNIDQTPIQIQKR